MGGCTERRLSSPRRQPWGACHLSNPVFVSLSEGSRGAAGYYDLPMLQREWHIASQTPGRHMLGIYLKVSGEPVGMADYLDENPSDGMPWLGLLLIAGSYHRRGLGAEAYHTLAAHFHDALGWTALRLGLLEECLPAQAFWRRLGFEDIERSTTSHAAQVIVMQRQLSCP